MPASAAGRASAFAGSLDAPTSPTMADQGPGARAASAFMGRGGYPQQLRQASQPPNVVSAHAAMAVLHHPQHHQLQLQHDEQEQHAAGQDGSPPAMPRARAQHPRHHAAHRAAPPYPHGDADAAPGGRELSGWSVLQRLDQRPPGAYADDAPPEPVPGADGATVVTLSSVTAANSKVSAPPYYPAVPRLSEDLASPDQQQQQQYGVGPGSNRAAAQPHPLQPYPPAPDQGPGPRGGGAAGGRWKGLVSGAKAQQMQMQQGQHARPHVGDTDSAAMDGGGGGGAWHGFKEASPWADPGGLDAYGGYGAAAGKGGAFQTDSALQYGAQEQQQQQQQSKVVHMSRADAWARLAAYEACVQVRSQGASLARLACTAACARGRR